MLYKIAIASGKGGTGKTTIAVCLFDALSKVFDDPVQLLDCDVEEPNDSIFFDKAEKTDHWEINQLIPVIDADKCTYCRKCVEYCEFNAIVVIPPVQFAEVNPSLCHSCGACSIACKFSAITEKPQPIGVVNYFNVNTGEGLLEGRLKIGSAMQTMLIKELKKKSTIHAGLLLYDAPPGTSCPVVETAANVNYILLVAEPTPFGLHDLKLTVELLSDIQKEFGIIINKSGLGDNKIYQYIADNQLDLLGEIPYSERFASMYASGDILKNLPSEIDDEIKNISLKLLKRIKNYAGDNHIKR